MSETRDLIDISVVLSHATPEWPGDTPFSCGWSWEIARGASVNVSVLSGSPHVGTHADAPLHVGDGLPGASELPLTAFIGEAMVVDVSRQQDERALSLADVGVTLDALRGGRLLLRTGRSIAAGVFPDGWPALSIETARALADAGARLLGVDAPSVDLRESKTLDVHRALFDGGVSILENLDLREVETGRYFLSAAPIRIEGADAAPVRAVLHRRLGGFPE